MTQDYAYSFASFAAPRIDCEGESISTMRLFGDYEQALDYARELVNGSSSYDYAYVSGVYPDGSMELKDVTRVADDEPSVVSL